MRSTLALLVGILLLGGWQAPAATGAEEPGPFQDYVALGDSYTAGPLIPTQTPGPLGCFRSSDNYPAFLANYLGVRTFTDVSCSAARSENLREPQTGNLPGGLPQNQNAPQLFALTGETDLVTLGIGGNDKGLFGGLIDNCPREAMENPDASAPCKDFFTDEKGIDTKSRDARDIETNIDRALRDIRSRAPQATVVVVNYLHILPETGTCDEVPFAEGDYRWATTVQLELNDSLRRAAATNGATYVDMYAASLGRDACADDPWVNGKLDIPADLTRALNYHPFRAGMKGIADTTFTQLTGEAPPAISLPALELRKRLPALIDVEGLLDYVANDGFVPPGILDKLVPPDTEEPTNPTEPAPAPDDDIAVEDAAALNPTGGGGEGRAAPASATTSSTLPEVGGPQLTLLAGGLGLVVLGTWLTRRRQPAQR